jgi:hypothetical protein
MKGKHVGGDHEGVLPCLTANMAWSLIRLGYLNDERVQKPWHGLSSIRDSMINQVKHPMNGHINGEKMLW